MRSQDIEFVKKYRHIMCFVLSGVLLFASLINYHSASLSEDFIQTTGEITNVKKGTKYVHGTRRYEYDFDVFWEMDGQTYKKHYDDQLDYHPEGVVEIWVSSDNQYVRFSSSEEVYRELPLDIAGGVAAGILGFILLKRKRKYISKAERTEKLEDRRIYSVLAFLIFASIGGFFGYDIYKEYQKTLIYNVLYADIVVVSIVGMLVCVGLFMHAHVKLKQ